MVRVAWRCHRDEAGAAPMWLVGDGEENVRVWLGVCVWLCVWLCVATVTLYTLGNAAAATIICDVIRTVRVVLKCILA